MVAAEREVGRMVEDTQEATLVGDVVVVKAMAKAMKAMAMMAAVTTVVAATAKVEAMAMAILVEAVKAVVTEVVVAMALGTMALADEGQGM